MARPMRQNKRYFYWGLTAVLTATACFIIAELVFNLRTCIAFLSTIGGILQSILYGIVIAYLLNPLTHLVDDHLAPLLLEKTKLKKKTIVRCSRVVGILVAFAILAFVIYLLVQMVLPQLGQSLKAVTENLPSYYTNVEEKLLQLLENNSDLKVYAERIFGNIYERANEWIQTDLPGKVQTVLTTALNSGIFVFRTVFNLIVGLIVAVYVLLERDRFLAQTKKLTIAFLPAAKADRLMELTRRAHRIFGGFITGKILDSLIIGLLCYFGLLLIKTPYPMLLATIIGVTNIIPFFGPFLGAVPSAILLLLIDPWQCLYFVIFVLILQQLDGNVIGPHILGDATGISAFWVVFSITLFGGLFGFLGMVVGVPLFAVFYMLVSDWAENALRKKRLPTRTDEYYSIRRVRELGKTPDEPEKTDQP